MDALFMLSEQAGGLVPPEGGSSGETRLRYRILFADGSVGTRYYGKALRVGQRIVDGAGGYVISAIDREPQGSIGRARAVLAPS
jgi:hypothetical protein